MLRQWLPVEAVKLAVVTLQLSNTLTSADWQNSEILSGDVAAKVVGLKAEDGGDLVTSGSAATVRWLLGEGLLDELHLLVHPIVVGEGMARLFPADAPQTPLKLVSSERFETGVVYLTYEPAQRAHERRGVGRKR